MASIAGSLVVLLAVAWWIVASRPSTTAENRVPGPETPTEASRSAIDKTYPRVEHIRPAPIAKQAPASPESAAPTQGAPAPAPVAAPTTRSPSIRPSEIAEPMMPSADAASTRLGQAAPPATTAQPARTEPARPAAMPNVAELPAAERDQLPALKLTMHMWNQDSSQRFVILDGNRLGEGDRIGAATISRIDTDGVILELNGRVVRLPLR